MTSQPALIIPEIDPRHLSIALLVLQPSPFCNINCDYCYLPNRTSTKRMSMAVLEASLRRTFESELVGEMLTLVWHAGEPLAVPIAWYEEAFTVIERLTPPGVTIVHSFQSNGTLLNQAWCDFIKARGISLGLSVDGPAFLHDARRKTRRGEGTHAAAMRAVRLLQQNDIFFHVIAVITEPALDHPTAVYEFFRAAGVKQLGFNIEEVEGINTASSLAGCRDERVATFLQTVFDLQRAHPGEVGIREFQRAFQVIAQAPPARRDVFPYFNEQARPFGIVSIDCEGNFCTFSPELLGMETKPYGPFSFGNVLREDFLDALGSDKFQAAMADIQRGVQICAATCPHYSYCGGGAPANKLYENGALASGETMYCRYSVKMPLEIVMADLEKNFPGAT